MCSSDLVDIGTLQELRSDLQGRGTVASRTLLREINIYISALNRRELEAIEENVPEDLERIDPNDDRVIDAQDRKSVV